MMIYWKNARRFGVLAWGVALIAFGSAASAQQKVQISMAHIGPTTSPAITGTLVRLGKALEATGQVEVTYYGAGSAYSNPTKYFELVEKGVVDIAFGLPELEAGQFPLTLLAAEPFTFRDHEQGTLAIFKIVKTVPEIAKEFEKVHLISAALATSDQIHARKSIKSIDDVKGLRILVGSPALGGIIRELGGSVAVLPRSQLYENLQKGVVDAGVGTWLSLEAFNLYEVTNSHFEWNAAPSPVYIVMNLNKYNSLPPVVKKIVDEFSTEEAALEIAKVWTRVEQTAREKAKGLGHEISTISPEQRKLLQARVQPLTDARIEAVEKRGLPARRVYQAIIKAADEGGAR
jgi:TRAP-type C4-dicarboxylate transport system substrate-binding protein